MYKSLLFENGMKVTQVLYELRSYVAIFLVGLLFLFLAFSWDFSSTQLVKSNKIAVTFEKCDENNILNGHWEYSLKESTNFSRCPEFNKEVNETHLFYKQKEAYRCSEYNSAFYFPDECSMNSQVHSMMILSEILKDKTITFVGDSLTAQLAIAARCDMEFWRISLKMHFIFSSYLRPDIPCVESCLTNQTFLKTATMKGSFPTPCNGCPDGVKRTSMLSNATKSFWWMNEVPHNTKLLVLNTGAWYNSHHGIDHSAIEYAKTLSILKPILSEYVSKGVYVIWIDLPPLFDAFTDKWNKYEWDQYHAKNQAARLEMRDIGIVFLEISKSTGPRKTRDASISPDHLHWW